MDYEDEVNQDKQEVIQQAKEALDTIAIDDLRMLKAFKAPP